MSVRHVGLPDPGWNPDPAAAQLASGAEFRLRVKEAFRSRGHRLGLPRQGTEPSGELWNRLFPRRELCWLP